MPSDKKNDSFMRALCLGEIDEEILFPFPKLKDGEQETLKAVFDSIATWLKGRDNDFRKWDVSGEFPTEFIDEIKGMGLFSLVIPEEHGGLGLSSSGYSRTIQELAGYDASLAVTVGAHSSIGMRGLLLFGTEEQRKRYYPRLVTGELIASFCLTEPGAGSDAASIKTTATPQPDGTWVLNGEKIWVTNGGIAGFYTVFAKTDVAGGKITAFLVTRDMPGVSVGPHEDKMGLRANSTASVHFSDVKLGPEQVLGEVGKGFKVAMRILNAGRTGLGGGTVGAMKRSIRLASQQAKARVQFGRPIAEFGLVKQKLGHMMVECYATESAVIMLGGLIDRGYDDYAVEAAICKVFGSECLWRTIDEALQIAGGNGYMREFPYERLMRDARINRIYEGTNDILRLFIALTGMDDVAHQLKEVSQAVGNAMQDPIKGFGVFREYAKKRVQYATGIGHASMTKAHPLLAAYASDFDESVRALATMADRLLRKHKKQIVEKQFATRRLADMMIDLFVQASVLSRVTAEIESKGAAACRHELEIAQVFSNQARGRIRRNFGKIDDNDDELIKSLADHALEREGYRWDSLTSAAGLAALLQTA